MFPIFLSIFAFIAIMFSWVKWRFHGVATVGMFVTISALANASLFSLAALAVSGILVVVWGVLSFFVPQFN